MAESLTTTLFAQLSQIISDRFGVPAADIGPATVLEDISVDSLALIELTLKLQKQFGVSIDTDDVSANGTVGHLADVLADAVRKGR